MAAASMALPFPSRPTTLLRRRCFASRVAMSARQLNCQEEEPYSVLAAMRSPFNDIVVVDTPSSRFLLLDSSRNIHSMLNKNQIWTGSYWDEFGSLPAIVPPGPIAILGLGAGTAAHLLLELWPSLQVVGWEIDKIIIEMAREYFGLSNLENGTKAGGLLTIHIEDALFPSATDKRLFAGILVDLFFDGKVLPQLNEVATWLQIAKRLMPGGRIMVNCAGAHAETSSDDGTTCSHKSWIKNATIKALCSAFPGELSWKRMATEESENYLALTGPTPDLDVWSAAVPAPLSSNVKEWRPCDWDSEL